ncbi:MAG: peptidoglycan-binding domain-containing protein, partial [Paracoccaceae bacterium]
MFGVIRFFSLVICVSTILFASELRAQGAADVYVQIEARPAKDAALERAAAYAATFPNVQGFRVGNGWYGIALGPFTAEEAENQLRLLRNEGLIPSDSYITDQSRLGERFWPTTEAMAPDAPETTADSAADTATDTTADEPATEELAAAEAQPEPATLPEESRSEALASESLLASEGRMDLQRAMQWFGTYAGAIDGSFGKGTRGAMAAWQEAAGYEPTGVLTTAQRAEILTAWEEERTSLGLTIVTEEEAGIRIELPLGLVAFDHYDPPFATFAPKGDSGYQVLLISRQGDAKSLVALFERLQALSIIPMSGDRSVEKNSFQLNGEGNGTTAYAEARLDGSFIKGFALIAPTDDTHRRERVLAAMKASFA